ncbi:MAG: flagellar export protein FliJ [Ignavibacteriales bacterium]
MRQHAERQRALDEKLAERQVLFAAGVPARGHIDLAELAAASAAAVRFGREADARAAALQHSAERVMAERAVLLERRRDRKAMETLLDHRREEERVARNRAERKRLDELAGIRWQANNSAHSGGPPWD